MTELLIVVGCIGQFLPQLVGLSDYYLERFRAWAKTSPVEDHPW